MAPLIGFHSVIERPLSVRRVIPPTTTIAKTRPATSRSRLERERGRGVAWAWPAREGLAVLMRRSAYSLALSRRARGSIEQMISCNGKNHGLSPGGHGAYDHLYRPARPHCDGPFGTLPRPLRCDRGHSGAARICRRIAGQANHP